MPSASKVRRTLEDLEAAASVHRPVQDRLADEIPLDQVRVSPRNPRHKLDALDDLAASLQEYGLLQPVVVRRVDGAYELIAGHRRLAAARQLGWRRIGAVVRDESDDQAYLLTLTENLQREDLTPKEEAAALEVLVRERGWTTRQVGEAIKRSHMYVSRRLRVFDDPTLAPLVLERKLPVSTAEELLRVPDPHTRQALAARAVEGEWTWAEARRAISDLGTARSKWADLASHLTAVLDTAPHVDGATLSAADRRLVRRAVSALRAVIRTSA